MMPFCAHGMLWKPWSAEHKKRKKKTKDVFEGSADSSLIISD